MSRALSYALAFLLSGCGSKAIPTTSKNDSADPTGPISPDQETNAKELTSPMTRSKAPLGELEPEALSKLTLPEWKSQVTCPKGTTLGEPRPGWHGCTRKDGTMHGLMSYWSEGQILWHRAYHEGESHGRSLGWHATGAPERHENFVHGKQHGPSRGWHANGQVFFERHYEEGQRHGLAVRHFANGVKSSQGKLEHGKLVGLHENWYESGQIKSHLRHVEGDEYASETWRSDGTREAKGNNKGWMKSGEWLYYDAQDRIRLREEYDGNLNLFRRTEYDKGKQVKTQKLVPPMPQVRTH